MKRTTLFTAIMVSFGMTTVAQTNIFPDNGNVGIGTLAPTSWFSDKVLQIEGTRPTLRLAPLVDGGIGTILFKGKFSEGINGSEDEFHFNYNSSSSNPFLILGSYKNEPKTIISFLGSGNVGIGTDVPDQKLTVNGTVQVYNKDTPVATWDNLRLWSEGENSIIESNGDEKGLIIRSNGGNKILLSGDVGIGTTTPREKLSVNGKIRAHEIKVETSNWPDYVFADDYKTTSLPELESYIKANKHLPEMPSAKEVEANGVALGEMVKIQQKKIEELTLHLIEKDKQMDLLMKRMDILENKKKE